MINSVAQLKRESKDLAIDSGMEFLWFLEDAYEQRDIQKLLSIVSAEFKKGYFKFKSQLEREFKRSEELELYILLRSKDCNLSSGIYSYNICWSKRVRKEKEDCFQREHGKARIMFKISRLLPGNNFLLYDIVGNSPFGQI